MAVIKEKANGKNTAAAKDKSTSTDANQTAGKKPSKGLAKDKFAGREKDGNPVTSRIIPEAAVVAAKAMVGNGCTDELATEIVEVVRVHVEFPYAAYIAQLHEELAAARAEITARQSA